MEIPVYAKAVYGNWDSTSLTCGKGLAGGVLTSQPASNFLWLLDEAGHAPMKCLLGRMLATPSKFQGAQYYNINYRKYMRVPIVGFDIVKDGLPLLHPILILCLYYQTVGSYNGDFWSQTYFWKNKQRPITC